MTLRTRRGQSTVETVMLISVLAIAMVAMSYALIPGLQGGLQGQQLMLSTVVDGGVVDKGS